MIITVHGNPAYCYTGGKMFDPALPTVVFIHGAQNDHSVWALQSRNLAHHGYGVLAVDLPGHGRSTGPALPTVEAMAAWLLAVLDAAGVNQALLAGPAWGPWSHSRHNTRRRSVSARWRCSAPRIR